MLNGRLAMLSLSLKVLCSTGGPQSCFCLCDPLFWTVCEVQAT